MWQVLNRLVSFRTHFVLKTAMKGKLNLVIIVKKNPTTTKTSNTWQLCLGPSNFGWCSSGFRSTNPSGSNPSTLSSPFSSWSPKTVEEFEEIFGEWLFWWPLCTFKMSSLVFFFFFLNISLTGKPGWMRRLQNLCFTYEPAHFMVSSTNCRKLRQRRGDRRGEKGEVIALRNLRHASCLRKVSRVRR